MSAAIRDYVRETHLEPGDFVYPLFVVEGEGVRREISSMPGQFQWSVDRLVGEVRTIASLGINAVMLFGIPSEKDACGSENFDSEGIVPQAIRAIKQAVPEMVVISDMCFCEYTDHGHCGILTEAGEVDNDATLERYAAAAVAQAAAGSQVIAPSGMMDGQVGAIRAALDANGFADIPILAYSAKYASAFYGPFREAAECAPRSGDRSAYQQDPAGPVGEALREVRLDLAEGADAVMVKPALAYLDILRQVRDLVEVPVAAYQVSGEYAMIEAAARNGWIDRERAIMESIVAIRRAGADLILTYWASEMARRLS